MDLGLDPDARFRLEGGDDTRGTPLYACVQMLAKCGPPNMQYHFNKMILHEIEAMGDHVFEPEREAFAAAAMDAGARLDLRDDLLKTTPLGWAGRWGRLELVRWYLGRGADAAEERPEAWARPLDWAERRGDAEVAALLR